MGMSTVPNYRVYSASYSVLVYYVVAYLYGHVLCALALHAQLLEHATDIRGAIQRRHQNGLGDPCQAEAVSRTLCDCLLRPRLVDS